MNIAINGFGRIGRQCLRILLKEYSQHEVVLINDLSDGETLAHLFEFDSTYGRFDCGGACYKDGMLATSHGKIRTTACKDPSTLPHKELGVDVVLECTGVFRTKESASLHLEAGAKKVLLSAPAKDEIDGTFVIGVNDDQYNSETMNIISNASCTTNCLAPLVKVLDDTFGVEHGLMTTIHSYTNDQRILDLPHKDWRRARSAAENIIPTSTGAAKAVGLVIPHLQGKLNGISVRVPHPTVSLTDLTCILGKDATRDQILDAYRKAEAGHMRGILGVEDRPLVSQDYVGDSRSCIIDSALVETADGNMVKVLGWYDNEWGYASRLVQLATIIGEKL